MENNPVGTPSIDLKNEEAMTLASERRKYGFLAKALFFSMNLFYGRKKTFSKFKVLEVIARVPYQSWEHVAYIAMTHTYAAPHFARRIFEFVKESRKNWFSGKAYGRIFFFIAFFLK